MRRGIISKAVCVAAIVVFICLEAEAATTGRKPASPIVPTKTTSKDTRIMDPAFTNAGKTAGIEIWRIEDFKPVAYPKNDYGKFFTGDSYIVLNTVQNKKGEKSWDIHFWLGKDTSQDEAGAAAILSVQLDELLGGAPVQHREVQEHESHLFQSYFKSGLRYVPGGINSGFTHVDRNAYTKKLYQVKGKRNVRVKQVAVSITSMNKGDCFILEAGKNIYVYVGSKAKRMERLKAITAANLIRDQDHAGSAAVHIIDESATESEVAEFFQILGGGSQSQVADESAGGDDEAFERNQETTTTLYRVSDAKGKLQIDTVASKPLQQSLLDTNDCFILDAAGTNIYVWVGKKCNQNEKTQAMQKAQQFLSQKNYPAWTNIQRLIEGGETSDFTQNFQGWRGYGETHRRILRETSSEEVEYMRFIHAVLKPNGVVDLQEIFTFKQDDLVEEDVMILDLGNKVYIWVGKDAEEEEKTASIRKIKEDLKALDRTADFIVINQGDEPEEFKDTFPAWLEDVWENTKTYEQLKNELVQ